MIRKRTWADRAAGWALALGFGAWCCVGAITEESVMTAESVRRAIVHLSQSYGAQYADVEAHLEALTALEHERENISAAQFASRLEAVARRAFSAHPLLIGEPLVFVVRSQYQRDHHNTATFFPSAANEYNDGAFTPGGALKTIEFARGGQVRTLLTMPDGVIRDPEVHFSGSKILFSMRTNLGDSYHLYEIDRDGSNLKQLTSAHDVDDLDPFYLADGHIAFSSTREPKYCMCNRHIMANLFRMEPDGANIHQIGKSTLFEGHGSLTPDGRVLYDRWEYVDRNFGDAQALWVANPDGTAHTLFWGNNTASPGGVIDARVIPGTGRAICVFGSCHDRPWGALAIVDPALGMDGERPVVRIWPASARKLISEEGGNKFDAFMAVALKYEDPSPLDEHFFLCSRQVGRGEEMGIYLVDLFGNEVLLYAEAPGCFDPMPLRQRARPPVMASHRNFSDAEGSFYVQDVYQGSHMANVKRGAVKFLRIVESPEKRFWTHQVWGGQGIEGPAMNWHDFNNKRILGTVPVASDGSLHLLLPAERFVYFQLLDERGMMIQSMRSGVMLQPGESSSCVGCHENRQAAPGLKAYSSLLQAPPQRPVEWFGPERDFSFMQEVQPVFNRHCVSCHDYGNEAGQVVNLAPDRDLVFNTAYNELWRKKFIRVVGAGPPQVQPAFSWGAHASRLTPTLAPSHYDVRLAPEEFARVVTWIDLNAPYYPTYACAYPDNMAGRCPLDDTRLARLEELCGIPLRKLAAHDANQGPQVSFDRPELSPCLARIADAQARIEALELIRAGAAALAKKPEADAEGFETCGMDQWRQKKYLARRETELRSREAIRTGKKVYDLAE